MTRFAIPWLAERSPLRGLLAFALLIGLASAGGCSGQGDPAAAKQPVRTSPGAEYRHDDPSASGDGDSARGAYGDSAQSSETGSETGVPPEITTVAGMLLGSSAEVVAFGDFAGNGHEQALVVNRIVSTHGATGWMIPEIPTSQTAAVPFTRATVIERDGARWIEVLRCDEHLKNPKGFLSGTPVSPVTGWSVQLHTEVKDKRAGGAVREFTFSPLQTSEPAAPPIVVKWNAKVHRYQAFDRANQQFLGEVASLEMPASKLR